MRTLFNAMSKPQSVLEILLQKIVIICMSNKDQLYHQFKKYKMLKFGPKTFTKKRTFVLVFHLQYLFSI